MAKKYRILRGSEKGDKRFEAGDVVTDTQLKSWPVKALIAKGAIEEVKEKAVDDDPSQV